MAAIWQYAFSSFLIISLFVFLGFGITSLVCPREVKKHAFFLAPLVGYCYATLVGWYGYQYGLQGTDSYAPIILIPPLIFFAVALLQKKKQSRTDYPVVNSSVIVPVVLGIAVFFFVCSPFFFNPDGMTSMSLGNNDLADYSAGSRYLKEFAPSDTIGFLGQSAVFKEPVLTHIFGSAVATALASSLFSWETYQLQSIFIIIFFSFGILPFYALARESFGYNRYSASGITALYATSPMLYFVIYQGFQAQIFSMGLALCIFFLHFHAIANGRTLGDYYSYIPLAVFFHWGITVTYAHMLPFIYVLLFSYSAMVAIHNKSLSGLLRWGVFASIVFVVVFLLSPQVTKTMVHNVIFRATIAQGWFIPWFSPDAVFGQTFGMTYLQPHGNLVRFTLSLPLLVLIAAGLIGAYKNDRELFILAGSHFFIVVIAYVLLCFLGRNNYGWGGYNSFKWLSFFSPLILLSAMILYRNSEFSLHRRLDGILSLFLIFLIGCSIYSGYRVVRQMTTVHRSVSKDMADLKMIEKIPLVESINIVGKDCWDVLWENNFLMRKKLFFEASTYAGRPASPLIGQWNLLKNEGSLSGRASPSKEIIFMNSSYLLERSSDAGN